MMHRRCLTIAGSTLVEAMLACGIVALFMAGLYDMNWRGLSILKSGVDLASATQITTDLSERVRAANWAQVTDPTYLSGTVLANSTAVGHLPNAVQTIDVNSYPVANAAEFFEVQRDSSGAVTTMGTGNGIANESAIQIDITVSWKGTFNSISHARSVRLIVSQGGILGQN